MIHIAKNFISRLVGLIGRSSLLDNEGLLIPNCRQVHTAFMRFPIDAVFIDANNIVIAIFVGVLPWRVTPKVPQAAACLELAAGGAKKLFIQLGKTLPYNLLNFKLYDKKLV